MSIDRRWDKEDVRYTPICKTEYYSAMKMTKYCHVASWMDLEGILLNEVNQMEKDKNCMILLICET